MPVRIRFALHGPRHSRIFHMVVVDSTKRRDARPLETLAVYDPQLKPGEDRKTVKWSSQRIKHWLRQGAEPSTSVVRLLTMGGILSPTSRYHQRHGDSTTQSS
ncbi:30S ribosomal protein S16 [Phanerochaete sordida]|uniref:30S ribosomal protein S16 n=1 Tax=Phanerochaete sordida TaxID=48140 RepID=A0A9P3L853_9APHY|nr:30S ribosomal protein S16 [Phanerochaete sordida]